MYTLYKKLLIDNNEIDDIFNYRLIGITTEKG